MHKFLDKLLFNKKFPSHFQILPEIPEMDINFFISTDIISIHHDCTYEKDIKAAKILVYPNL